MSDGSSIFWNSNSWKNSEWLTIILPSLLFTLLWPQCTTLIQLLTVLSKWAVPQSADNARENQNQNKLSLFTIVFQQKTENHYAMRLDETRKEEVSRALFSRLRREKALDIPSKPLVALRKSVRTVVLSCALYSLLKCGQIENQTYQTTWNYWSSLFCFYSTWKVSLNVYYTFYFPRELLDPNPTNKKSFSIPR